MREYGLDPLPEYIPPAEFKGLRTEIRGLSQDSPNDSHSVLSPQSSALVLISGASHHYVSSSMANVPSLMAREGTPFVEINPADAAERSIVDGDTVMVENERGWCELRAVVTDAVRQGVAVSPKGRWPRRNDGRNVNWTTPDALADMAGQSTFHSNRVWVRRSD